MKRIKDRLLKLLSVILIVGIIIQTISGVLIVSADEVSSGLSMQYYSGSSWTSFSNKVITNGITALKLTTNSNNYYLQYSVQMSGKTAFWSAVNSNQASIDQYAGAGHLDKAYSGMDLLRIRVINSKDNSAINSEIVVMYRVKSGGEWLPWVSNADPEWMEAVKSKYNLDGKLDTSSSYAGKAGYSIEGIEIRLYEEPDLVVSDSFEGKEISANTSYVLNGGSAWVDFTNKAESGEIDRIRINTNSEDFYLTYQTKSSGDSGLASSVFSNNTSAYCGKPNKPIELLSIKAYSKSGAKLVGGIIVMYRVKIESGWLSWVSNANPEYMKSIKNQYGLDGELDTRSSYAGKNGYNILGVEIRIFKGDISEFETTDLSGTEYKPQMWYATNSSTLNSFDTVTPQSERISAVKIITSENKPYYLSYCVRAEGKGSYYSEVKSTVNDYAGVFGNPIQALKINVYDKNGTSKVTKGIVVMYRAYTDRWLPWVSNADPAWMQSVKLKYGISGPLDTKSGYAGETEKNIKAIEIRIFEENSIATSCGSTNSKTVSAPYIYQVDNFPTGCESVSAVMALQKAGVNMTVATFVDRYLDKDPNRYNFNPNTHFGGNPRLNSGMGCYAPVIMEALNQALAGKTQYAKNVSGTSVSSLCSQYIDKGIPVIMWATMEMAQGRIVEYSDTFTWRAPEHCLLLVGYDSTCYIFHDPLRSAYVHYIKEDVETAYEFMQSQAIVVMKGDTASNPPANGNTPDKLPNANAVEYVKKNENKGSSGADPIDLFTGSHVIDNSIISLFGGNKTAFLISYNSSKLVSGNIGAGWYHNFEKRLDIGDNIAYVYESPSVYSVYEKTSENTYSCTTKSKENYIITVLTDGSYELDCNKNGKMYFSDDGKLTATEDKQGFKTTLSYTDNTIVINDAINGSITLNLTDGLITSVTDGIRTAELNYSGGYLVSIKDVNGERLYYTYNADGQVETGADDNGTVYFTDYYTNGKITKQIDGSGNNAETNFIYTETENGITVEVNNRNGDSSISSFNNFGQLISFTDENGNTTSHTYDSNLNLTSTTDAEGNTERTEYNSNNLPVRLVDKNGNITTFAYDENHNVLSIIYGGNGDSNKDGFIDIKDIVCLKKYLTENLNPEYDSFLDVDLNDSVNALDIAILRKYLIGSDKLFVASEMFAYNNCNQIISYCNVDGTTTKYVYDSNAMLISKTIGNRTEFYKYENGNVIESIDANGNKTLYEYNSLNQVKKQMVNVTVLSYTDEWWGENALLPIIVDGSAYPIYPVEREETHTTEFTYDNKGNVLTTTDADGNTISRTYDGNGLVTSETDANGNTTYYSYNGNMKIEYVNFSGGTYIYYDYDGEDRLISVKDQKGNNSYTEYDKAGRVIRKSDAEKNTIEYTYDNIGNVLSTVNYDGGITEYSYDNNSNVLTQKDTLGNITTNSYDRFNRVISTTNAMGGITQYEYSLSGNLLKIINPLNNICEYTYDVYGNKLTEKDFNGNQTVYTYDANNNLLTVTDALGNVTTNIYDSKNRIIETENADGSKIKYSYDAMGRLTAITDAKGGVTSYTYDPNGNVLTVTDALGNVQTTNQYDEFNRVISTTSASGGTTVNSYDELGNLTTVTDSLGNTQSYSYDNINRAVAVKDKAGNKTFVKYNSTGNILSLTFDGATENYTYDSNGNVLSETTSSGGLVQYTYNALNLKQEQTNARGQQRTYFYDVSGRITGYTSPEGNASFTYDNNGNVLTATDQNGTVTRTFDALNRVLTYTDTLGKTISYEHDSVGNLTKLTYPDNTCVTYSYDLNRNLTTVTDWAGRITSYTYDANNNIIGVTKPDGSVTETRYDTAQRVIYTAERVNNNIIVGYEYTYDTEGRILTETDLAANVKSEYTYDSLSRVTKRKITNLSNNSVTEENYTYDENGNILSSAVNTDNDSFVYDTNNRLIEYNGQAVTYDSDGNMLTADGIALTYDSANRLLSAGNNTYTYDVENTRVKNLCDGVETEYTYNTNAELSQLLVKTTGNTVTKYVYANGLIGEETAGIFKTYHFDFRGSTVAITDSNGTVTDTFTYDSYGNVISRTGATDTIFLYNGEYGVITDSNGLLYMRARYYNPELRRFVNADILMGDINNSSTLNRYAYANGNPISNIDPFGLAADEGRGGGHNDIIIKALQKTQENLKSYYRLNSDINGYNVTFNDALSKIINSLSNGNELEDFADGIKVQIKINSNYNTSSDELITEIGGFIPVLGELMALVNFVSDEDKDYWNLIDAVISAATEKDMSKILPYTDKLSIIGNIVDVIGVINLGETIINWNSKAKVSTEISVFIQKNNGSSYMYQAIVNNKMKFKEMYSGFTGSVIKSSDERYNVLYK